MSTPSTSGPAPPPSSLNLKRVNNIHWSLLLDINMLELSIVDVITTQVDYGRLKDQYKTKEYILGTILAPLNLFFASYCIWKDWNGLHNRLKKLCTNETGSASHRISKLLVAEFILAIGFLAATIVAVSFSAVSLKANSQGTAPHNITVTTLIIDCLLLFVDFSTFYRKLLNLLECAPWRARVTTEDDATGAGGGDEVVPGQRGTELSTLGDQNSQRRSTTSGERVGQGSTVGGHQSLEEG